MPPLLPAETWQPGLQMQEAQTGPLAQGTLLSRPNSEQNCELAGFPCGGLCPSLNLSLTPPWARVLRVPQGLRNPSPLTFQGAECLSR